MLVAFLARPAGPSSPDVSFRTSGLASAPHHSPTFLDGVGAGAIGADWLNLNCCCQNTPKYTLPAFSPPSSLRISHVRLPVFAHGSRHLYTAVHRLAALVKFFLLPPPPAHAWWSLHLFRRVFLPSCSSTARPQPRAKLACPPKCCLQNTRDRPSTPAPCRPVHAADLRALCPSPHTPPSSPKPAHPASPTEHHYIHIPQRNSVCKDEIC